MGGIWYGYGYNKDSLCIFLIKFGSELTDITFELIRPLNSVYAKKNQEIYNTCNESNKLNIQILELWLPLIKDSQKSCKYLIDTYSYDKVVTTRVHEFISVLVKMEDIISKCLRHFT